MDLEAFRTKVQAYRRLAGTSQQALARALGLQPQVLSRKLSRNSTAYLTHAEVKHIIKTLSAWEAITSRSQAIELLALMDLKATSFTPTEWDTPPLNQLEATPLPTDSRAAFEHERVAGADRAARSGGVLLGSAQQRLETPAAPASFRPHQHLPAPITRLIGRTWAVERVRKLLAGDDVRIVTLLGPGGVGKTRLALQVAAKLLDSWTHGVTFVALSGVTDSALVPQVILQTLSVQGTPTQQPVRDLNVYLQDKQLLLVLDNFEHVLAAAGMIGDALAAAPALKVLVTSRTVLHLYGEHEFSVPPLDLPALDQLLAEPERLEQYEAIQLFVERARAVQPTFALTRENGPAIAQICARVDGLPLGIELAAARIKVMAPTTLLQQLDANRLDLLTGGARNLPPRQQTLSNTLAWSYALLTPVEQHVFARLSVFRGPWTGTAAHAICGLDGQSELELLDLVGSLVDNSLVVAQPGAESTDMPRTQAHSGSALGSGSQFMLLETLRDYAAERLMERGETTLLRHRHADYYLQLAEARAPQRRGSDQQRWLEGWKTEQDNLRAALQWALDSGETEMGLRLAAAVWQLWDTPGRVSEGRHWLEQLLTTGSGTLATRARALYRAGLLARTDYDFTRSAELSEASLALCRELDDKPGMAWSLFNLGEMAGSHGDYAREHALKVESATLFRAAGNRWGLAQALLMVAHGARIQGDYATAHAHLQESLAIWQDLQDTQGIALAYLGLGHLAYEQGAYNQAEAILMESLRLRRELADTGGIASVRNLLGDIAFAQAVRLFAAATALRERIGAPRRPVDCKEYDRDLAAALSQLKEAAFTAAWTHGRALALEDVIADALSQTR